MIGGWAILKPSFIRCGSTTLAHRMWAVTVVAREEMKEVLAGQVFDHVPISQRPDSFQTGCIGLVFWTSFAFSLCYFPSEMWPNLLVSPGGQRNQHP